MTYEHAAIDMETLDVKASAIVVSLGAVAFDADRMEDVDEIAGDESRGFYRFPDMDIQALDGRTTDTTTVRWWINQGVQAKAVFSDSIRRESPQQVLDHFTEFVRTHGIKYIWGYGNMFDNAILESLYRTYRKPFPINFRGNLDIRTLEVMAGKRLSELNLHSGVVHNAFDDALNQARGVQHLFRRINNHGAGARIAISN
jgi:hypothetical protein